MFRHQGKMRTQSHNIKIASLLSFVAGIVNVAGFLAVERLTTNVTGHFAFFTDEVFKLNFLQAFIYFLYIFFFLAGSFFSSFLTEAIIRKNADYVFIVPIFIEAAILLLIAFYSKCLILHNPDVIAFSLLFAMGLQNSLVTKISNSIVRTTHLTGLFTDLGIDLSQLFFYKTIEQKKKLSFSIKLRLTIISFFFFGGIVSGVFYSNIKMYVLVIAAICLVGGVVYDGVKYRLIRLKRKCQGHFIQ